MFQRLSDPIQRNADATPEQVAFAVPGRTLTCAQLETQANQLAHLLINKGVRPGDRVGIYLQRGLETPVAVFGILKAGAIFVPLDPFAPPAATLRLLDACGIHHLLTHPAQRRCVAELVRQDITRLQIIGIDQESLDLKPAIEVTPWQAASTMPMIPPDLPSLDLDTAYIMFSSGSTGRPKGIAHSHRSGLAYASASCKTYGIDRNDRIGSHSPLHFDMSTLGYLSGPFAGATTVIIPEAHTKIAASLSKLIADESITVWYSVPLALIQLLLRGTLDAHDYNALRWVLFGGEPFPIKHLRSLMQTWPDARFSNVYGPAEVNQCTFYHVPAIAPEAETPIPIGRVWDQAEGMIVDPTDQTVAEGEPGELLIRSSTMMRGYWNRPDLNANAFYRRTNLTGDVDIFYRTGDLVQERSDGELMFLGRRDRQLKVRGYRVELDDVEHALTGHPGVEEAAAFKIHTPEGDSIAACVTASGSESIDTESLRKQLATSLSWYAVPERIETRDTLPRTTSGKIDRRRLQTEFEEKAAV